MITGVQTAYDVLAASKIIDMHDIVFFLENDADVAALTVLTKRKNQAEVTKAYKYEFLKDKPLTRWDSVTVASAAAAASVDVADTTIYQVGWLVEHVASNMVF